MTPPNVCGACCSDCTKGFAGGGGAGVSVSAFFGLGASGTTRRASLFLMRMGLARLIVEKLRVTAGVRAELLAQE
ncbi:hypothetical protein GN244_ATG16720 [Phytophthora infestans]|uniref:Uncharacterized protein n=1 Tax=Phytophthora infestans TaxID=4787 RepID=A0A833SA37_PHYIN|nr:hypothetical protein GN244_ATG16720 [Phytophthora infestans]